MDTIFRHAVVLAIALVLTWMIFLGAGYFGGVWSHYFAGEPPRGTSNPGEVSVKIINPTPHAGQSCQKGQRCPEPPNPHG